MSGPASHPARIFSVAVGMMLASLGLLATAVQAGAATIWVDPLTGSDGARGSKARPLRSLSEANALLVLPHDQGPVAAGDTVEVWLFDGLV